MACFLVLDRRSGSTVVLFRPRCGELRLTKTQAGAKHYYKPLAMGWEALSGVAVAKWVRCGSEGIGAMVVRFDFFPQPSANL